MSNNKLIRKVDTSVQIAGQVFPVLHWTATLANQGSMGTASAEGALSDLIDSGLDIISASQDVNGAEFDIFIGYDGDIQRIFSGVVDTCNIDFDNDKFEVKGRDHSASFSDGKQTVAAFKYRNQNITDIVQQICDQFGFQADITKSSIKAGAEMNNEHSFNPHPQTYWSLLQSMAEQIGYECYMTPDQKLYFGPEKDQGTVTVDYGATAESGAKHPAWGLTVDYNPRNNSDVVVKALSVNPQTTQKVTSKATARKTSLKKGRKGRKSFGTKRVSSSNNSKPGSKGKKKSVLYIRCPGMTPEQAQARCQSMADNLAKHQIIVNLSIEGLPSLKIHSSVEINESTIDLYGFGGIPLNVAEVTHEFSMPGDGDSSGGFTTSFRAMATVEN